jgi:PKD repeat protein
VETFATWSTTDPYAPDMGLVDLQAGPTGDLFIADITGGRIVRVRHGEAPALAAPTTRGASPLAVAFAVSGATPAPGASVQSYAWDLDGDGTTDERTSEPRVSHVYGAKGLYRARVTVEYSDGDRERTDALPVAVDPPREVAITTPGDPAAVRWSVGERIAFAGRASAGDTGAPLPASALGWSLVVRHCAEGGDCHSHRADSQLSGLGAGNTGASGVLTGPEHEFPAHVELRLVASDPAVPGLQTERTVRLDPATVRLLVTSEPAGVVLAAGGRTGPGPLNVQVIRRSALTVDAPAETRAGGRRALFDGWSDGGAARHVLTPGADASLTARYVLAPGLVAAPALRGVAEAGRTLSAAASFDGSPSTVAWRWERCTPAGACTAIPGAAGARLRPGQADVGRRLRAVATAVNRAGEASGAVVSRLVLPAARPPVRVSRRDTARVALRCPAPRRCAAQIAVRAAADGGGEGFRVAFRRLAGLPARTLARVPVRLTPAARRALARRGALRVHATVRVRAPGGPERVVHTRFRLLAPRR